ncbi:MAG: sulfite exporter TauE/SafE family protein [Mesorhizobium sp.]|nr:sulfite exporter TauE/SafE family protein [Mesorhizobium sp.]
MLDPTFLLTDPMFYAVAVPAVILVGLSKGGLGGAAALMGVPVMALVINPVQAAAILLPILIVMDLVSLWTWRHWRDFTTLKVMLPGAMIGIGLGWLTAAVVTVDAVRLIVGLVAVGFVLRWFYQLMARQTEAAPHNRLAGAWWGMVAGFTSFVAHAGGPPYQVYAMRLRQDPKIYTGTAVMFFAAVNAVKLVPYFALGLFDTANLAASAVLVPIAPLATLAGAWIVKRMKPEIFYPFMYTMVLLVGLKLVWDGLLG